MNNQVILTYRLLFSFFYSAHYVGGFLGKHTIYILPLQ